MVVPNVKYVVMVSRTMGTCGNGAHLLLQAWDADGPSKGASMGKGFFSLPLALLQVLLGSTKRFAVVNSCM